MSDESDIPLGRRGLWELSRSGDALAKGIGCDETNPRRIGVMPLVQPVFSVEEVIQRGEFPGWSQRGTSPAVVGLRSVVELQCVSELRFRARLETNNTIVLIQRTSVIDAGLVESAPTNPFRADLLPRTVIRIGTSSVFRDGIQINSSTQPDLEMLIPAGSFVSFMNATVNLAMTVGFLAEERDGRVIMPDSA